MNRNRNRNRDRRNAVFDEKLVGSSRTGKNLDSDKWDSIGAERICLYTTKTLVSESIGFSNQVGGRVKKKFKRMEPWKRGCEDADSGRSGPRIFVSV